MDLMLSLSRCCSPEGGLAQWSASGCAGGWWEEDRVGLAIAPTSDLQKGTNTNLAAVSNFL